MDPIAYAFLTRAWRAASSCQPSPERTTQMRTLKSASVPDATAGRADWRIKGAYRTTKGARWKGINVFFTLRVRISKCGFDPERKVCSTMYRKQQLAERCLIACALIVAWDTLCCKLGTLFPLIIPIADASPTWKIAQRAQYKVCAIRFHYFQGISNATSHVSTKLTTSSSWPWQ
eukprot:3632195-Pleurochrysis_carterae.AAC.2